MIKIISLHLEEKMSKVCRLCLEIIDENSPSINVNTIENNTGFMPYRDKLTACIPEIALDLVADPVICCFCSNALTACYEFKNRCLQSEEKIRNYVRENKTNPNKFIDLMEISNNYRTLINCNKTNDLIIIQLEDKIIEAKVEEIKPIREDVIEEDKEEEEETDEPEPIVIGDLICTICGMICSNQVELIRHKQHQHNNNKNDYVCNFCKKLFGTLKALRKHNSTCPCTKIAAQHNYGLMKRPHLPQTAKNRLKSWLMHHTYNPYPTEVEKQQFMKETNLTLLQVENWFINARRRILHDMIMEKRNNKTGH